MEIVTPATPAAPAQPAAPVTAPTQTAAQAAVAANDTSAFRAARRAERIGKPLPDVAVTAKTSDVVPATEEIDEPATPVIEPAPGAAPAQPEVPRLSRKEREQQDANERVRRAVEAATADMRAELDRLRQRADPAAPAQPEPAKEPEWKRIARMPDAPKLNDIDPATGQPLYETLEEHAAAMGLFLQRTLAKEQAERTTGEQLAAEDHRRMTTFDARVQEAAKVNPEIVSKIAPLAQELGRMSGPHRVIAQLVVDSEKGPQILEHFVDHPEALRALATLPEALRGLPVKAAVRAHLQHIVKQIGRFEAQFDTPNTPAAPARHEPKTLTDAPDVQTLGARPKESADPKTTAIKSGDTRAYRNLRRQERLAAQGR